MTGKEESEVNDCLSCKVTSTVTLLSIGAYLIYQGRIQKSSKYGLYTMGTGNKKPQNFGIYFINQFIY